MISYSTTLLLPPLTLFNWPLFFEWCWESEASKWCTQIEELILDTKQLLSQLLATSTSTSTRTSTSQHQQSQYFLHQYYDSIIIIVLLLSLLLLQQLLRLLILIYAYSVGQKNSEYRFFRIFISSKYSYCLLYTSPSPRDS